MFSRSQVLPWTHVFYVDRRIVFGDFESLDRDYSANANHNHDHENLEPE